MSNWFSFCTSVSHDENYVITCFRPHKQNSWRKNKQKGVKKMSQNWKCLSDLTNVHGNATVKSSMIDSTIK